MQEFLEKIDRDGFIYKNNPTHIHAEKEIIRFHDLSLKISLLRPIDSNYRDLLEEML